VLPDSHSQGFFRKVQNEDLQWNVQLIPLLLANRRYDWLADFIIDQIKDLAPDEELYIVDGGDFADMPALSSYDKGKASAENKRIDTDLLYSRDARKRMMQPVLAYLEKLKAGHRRLPKVHFIVCLGNHENRWVRFKNDNPAWFDFEDIDNDVTQAAELGAKVVPFLVPVEIAGIHFCHYYYKKDSRYAIGGVTPARALATFLKRSAVSFHTHEWHVHCERSILGVVKCLYAACYYEHDEHYPGPQGHANITRALTVLHDCKDGDFKEVKHMLDDLKAKYLRPEHGPEDWSELIADVPYTEDVEVEPCTLTV